MFAPAALFSATADKPVGYLARLLYELIFSTTTRASRLHAIARASSVTTKRSKGRFLLTLSRFGLHFRFRGNFLGIRPTCMSVCMSVYMSVSTSRSKKVKLR